MKKVEQGLAGQIVGWIKDQVDLAGARGAVFGLSGGLDSAVAGVLCRSALGDGALGAIMPCGPGSDDRRDALVVAGKFDIHTVIVDIRTAYESLLDALPEGSKMACANLKARLRMAALYHIANSRGYLVVGTGNKSEVSVGYFTKHGDGGADIFPLAGLYKTEVIDLAVELGVPDEVIRKPPSAGLWDGQTDEGELGMTYEELDRILKALEEGREPDASAAKVEKVLRMVRSSEHKRTPAPRFIPSGGGSPDD